MHCRDRMRYFAGGNRAVRHMRKTQNAHNRTHTDIVIGSISRTRSDQRCAAHSHSVGIIVRLDRPMLCPRESLSAIRLIQILCILTDQIWNVRSGFSAIALLWRRRRVSTDTHNSHQNTDTKYKHLQSRLNRSRMEREMTHPSKTSGCDSKHFVYARARRGKCGDF